MRRSIGAIATILGCIVQGIWGTLAAAGYFCEIFAAINNLKAYQTLTSHDTANSGSSRISTTSCRRIPRSSSTVYCGRAAARASSSTGTTAAVPGSMATAEEVEPDWGAGVREGMPSVTLKLAVDRIGAVDDMSEGPKRFTSPTSLDAVHRIRRDCDAVIVGVQTVVRDNPSLTVRRVPLYSNQLQPVRVVLDRTLRIPDAKVCSILKDGHASVVFHSSECEESAQRAVRLKAKIDASSETVVVPSKSPVDLVGLQPQSPGGGVPLTGALEALFRRGVKHVLVEGGPTTAMGFLSEALVDRAVIIRAPVEFARPVPSNIDGDTLRRAGLELIGCKEWGGDVAECWSKPGLPWPRGGVEIWP